MKKIKLLILMLLMSLALVACDGEEAPKDNDKEVVEDTKEPEATLTVTNNREQRIKSKFESLF